MALHVYGTCLLAFYCSAALAFLSTGTVTIALLTEFQGLRQCARDCLYYGHGDLGEQLECGDDGLHTPYLNTCLCRTDLTSDGSSYLTDCINDGCTSNSADLSDAISIWNSYCRSSARTTARDQRSSSITSSTLPANGTASHTTLRSEGVSSSRQAMTCGFFVTNFVGTATAVTAERSVLTVTATQASTTTVAANAPSTTNALSRSDQIALGVGISTGILTLLTVILAVNNRIRNGGILNFRKPQHYG